MDLRTLGAAIRAERNRQNLTRREVAEGLTPPVHTQSVACWECGTRSIGASRLFGLCELLKVRPSELLQQAEDHDGRSAAETFVPSVWGPTSATCGCGVSTEKCVAPVCRQMLLGRRG